MDTPRIVFFGSTRDSVIVLDALCRSGYTPVALVTQPPKPVGREKILTRTPVADWGERHGMTVTAFPTDVQKTWIFLDESAVTAAVLKFRPDLLVSASFGQKIPSELIATARYGGLNIHPSLLPRWRGADPVPWAILAGDNSTGVSVVTLSERFDEGMILSQKECGIRLEDEAGPLRSRLFETGAKLLVQNLPAYLSGTASLTIQQDISSAPYARRFIREDGFVPWEIVEDAMTGKVRTQESLWASLPAIRKAKGAIQHTEVMKSPASFLDRMLRALSPWPGVYTRIRTAKGELRLKILGAAVELGILRILSVQLEGKKPVPFNQFASAYLSSMAAGSS